MKKINPLVREILLVSIGELFVTVLMFAIFALGGFWTIKVLWGGLLGCGLAIINYCLMALGVAIASQKAAEQDVKGGKQTIQTSMFLRLALMAVVLFFAMKRGLANPIALVIPLFLFRPIISVGELFRKSGEKNVN